MELMRDTITNTPSRKTRLGDLSARWHVGRLHPVPDREPDGWELVDLTSVATLESGHTPSRGNPRYWNGSIPWVSLHDSQALDVPSITDTSQSVTELGIANSSARLLPAGTVIFSRTATVGKSTILGREMATSQDFANYVCGDCLHNRYLMYLFRFMQPEWTRLMAGSTHNTIYMPVFRVIQILVPPIDEQRAIAAALSDVDELIGVLDKLIAKRRAIKLAAMQQLLTGKTRLPGFEKTSGYKRTDVGVIPEDWTIKTLKQISPLQGVGCVINPSTYFDPAGAVPMLLGSNVQENHIDWESAKRMTEASNRILASSRLNSGDLVTVRVGEPGITAVIPPQWNGCNCASMMLTRKAPSFDSQWLCYMMNSRIGRMAVEQVMYGSAQKQFNISDAVDFSYPVPSLMEQRAIASALSDMDAEITALEQRRDKTRAIKQGMMQTLLTGKVRLVES